MCLTTAALHAGGDVIAQKFIEKKEHLEMMRTGRFFLIGLAWDGPLLSWWYRVLSRAIPSASKSATVLKVALDQGVFIPGMLFSFLVLNAGLKGMDQQDIKDILRRDYWQLLLANYQLWPAAMALNFYLMPVKHQVLFTNSVSLAWNTFLSWKANQELLKAANREMQIAGRNSNENADADAMGDWKRMGNHVVSTDVSVGDKNGEEARNCVSCEEKENSEKATEEEEEARCHEARFKSLNNVSLLTRICDVEIRATPALLP